MSKRSQAKRSGNIAKQLTFFAAGFPANPQASPESEKEPPIIAGSGLTFCAWCLKSNPCLCWRKILAESLHFALKECNSANGLRASLRLEVTNCSPSSWLLKTLARRIKESGFSSWATPRNCSAMAAGITDDAIANAANRFPNLETQIARMWPTPTAAEANKISNQANYGQIGLSNHPAIVGLPSRPKREKGAWPTPTTRDWKNVGHRESMELRAVDRAQPLPEVVINGQPDLDNPSTDGKSRALLNPRWVAQLQGFPSDWLDGIEWPL